MTSVTMPEPIFANGTYSAEQMQAYADARVRAALEEAADIADQHNAFSTYDAIHALIPKESA